MSSIADQLVLGAMTFGDQVEEADARRMVSMCLDFGITRFDTSNNYAEGRSEELLGRALADVRSDVLISTKVGSHVGQSDASVQGLGREALRRAVEGSLKRLAVDTIDIYYLHRPDRRTPIKETLETLAELVAVGKIQRVGQSNFAAWQITEMVLLAEAHGWPQPKVSQQMYNLLSRRIETEYVECARRFEIETIAYNPLAGGLLTGKHASTDANPAGRFGKEMYRDRYWKKELLDGATQLKAVASKAGLSLIQLSYRWLLTRTGVSAVLIGASSPDQLEQNLAAVDDSPLEKEVEAACDSVWDRLAGAAPIYNR